MSFFRKRPLFCFALSFYTAACMLYSFGAVSRIAFSAVALLISAIAVILSCKIPRVRACRTAIVAASLGILAAAAFSAYNIDVNYARLRRLSGENDTITGVIEHVGYTASYGGYYTVGVTASERGLAGRRLLLRRMTASFISAIPLFVTWSFRLSRRMLTSMSLTQGARICRTGWCFSRRTQHR